MKNQIVLAFIQEIENSQMNCLSVVTHENISDMHQSFCEYINLFSREIERIFSRVFNVSAEEIHPDILKDFMLQANTHIDTMTDCHRAICNVLAAGNQELALGVDVLRNAQLAHLEEKITASYIRDCMLSEEELRYRFRKGVAIISAKILITIAATGAMSVYIVPYFLVSGASTAATVVVYGATNSVASGVSTVACNAIDGKNGTQALENVPTSMLRGAISGGIFGGLNSMFSHAATTSTTTTNIIEKKIAVINMKMQTGEKIANTTNKIGQDALLVTNNSATLFTRTSQLSFTQNGTVYTPEVAEVLRRLNTHLYPNLVQNALSGRS